MRGQSMERPGQIADAGDPDFSMHRTPRHPGQTFFSATDATSPRDQQRRSQDWSNVFPLEMEEPSRAQQGPQGVAPSRWWGPEPTAGNLRSSGQDQEAELEFAKFSDPGERFSTIEPSRHAPGTATASSLPASEHAVQHHSSSLQPGSSSRGAHSWLSGSFAAGFWEKAFAVDTQSQETGDGGFEGSNKDSEPYHQLPMTGEGSTLPTHMPAEDHSMKTPPSHEIRGPFQPASSSSETSISETEHLLPPDLVGAESGRSYNRDSWHPPPRLDRLIQSLYSYFRGKGFTCILAQGFVDVTALGFTIAFSAFLLLFVDWPALFALECGPGGAGNALQHQQHPQLYLPQVSLPSHLVPQTGSLDAEASLEHRQVLELPQPEEGKGARSHSAYHSEPSRGHQHPLMRRRDVLPVEQSSEGSVILIAGAGLRVQSEDGRNRRKLFGIQKPALPFPSAPCSDLLQSAVLKNPFREISSFRLFLLGYLGALCLYWLFCVARLASHVRGAWGMRTFCVRRLQVSDADFAIMSWPDLQSRLVCFLQQHVSRTPHQAPTSGNPCVESSSAASSLVNEVAVTQTITRSEDLFLSLLDSGLLTVSVPSWGALGFGFPLAKPCAECAQGSTVAADWAARGGEGWGGIWRGVECDGEKGAGELRVEVEDTGRVTGKIGGSGEGCSLDRRLCCLASAKGGKVTAQGNKGAGSGQWTRVIFLQRTLEWSLRWCVIAPLVSGRPQAVKEFLSAPGLLRRRLVLSGVVLLALSPVLVLFLVTYFVLHKLEQLYHQPGVLGLHAWSNAAKWILRDYHELDHCLDARLDASCPMVDEYLTQFPAPLLAMLAKLVAYVAGSFAAVLLVVALMDESLLEAHLFGRNLLWYAAVCGAALAACRGLTAQGVKVSASPDAAMERVRESLGWVPHVWLGRNARTARVKGQVLALFPLKPMIFLEDVLSVLVTPLLLCFVFSSRAGAMLQVLSQETELVEGVGVVAKRRGAPHIARHPPNQMTRGTHLKAEAPSTHARIDQEQQHQTMPQGREDVLPTLHGLASPSPSAALAKPEGGRPGGMRGAAGAVHGAQPCAGVEGTGVTGLYGRRISEVGASSGELDDAWLCTRSPDTGSQGIVTGGEGDKASPGGRGDEGPWVTSEAVLSYHYQQPFRVGGAQWSVGREAEGHPRERRGKGQERERANVRGSSGRVGMEGASELGGAMPMGHGIVRPLLGLPGVGGVSAGMAGMQEGHVASQGLQDKMRGAVERHAGEGDGSGGGGVEGEGSTGTGVLPRADPGRGDPRTGHVQGVFIAGDEYDVQHGDTREDRAGIEGDSTGGEQGRGGVGGERELSPDWVMHRSLMMMSPSREDLERESRWDWGSASLKAAAEERRRPSTNSTETGGAHGGITGSRSDSDWPPGDNPPEHWGGRREGPQEPDYTLLIGGLRSTAAQRRLEAPVKHLVPGSMASETLYRGVRSSAQVSLPDGERTGVEIGSQTGGRKLHVEKVGGRVEGGGRRDRGGETGADGSQEGSKSSPPLLFGDVL